MKNNYCFMAFGKGTVTAEAVSYPKYIGVAPVKILAVNPNKAALEKIYGREVEEEPSYIAKVDIEGNAVDSARITFVIQTVEKDCGVNFTTNMTFFLQNRVRKGSQSGKWQLIDKYGRTAWGTENVDFKIEGGKFVVIQVPQYSNGPAQIDIDYRPAYVGEEELTTFIKKYLGIPDVRVYNSTTKTWGNNPKAAPEDCEARLTNVKGIFKNDFKELNEIISYQPENKVKVLFGVKSTDDGKQYQNVLTQMVLHNAVTNYSKLDAYIAERKAAGAFANIEYEVCNLKEYTVEATKFEAPTEEANELPFDGPNW